jgi:DNA-binding transcriptional ArsR family regulator
MRLDGSARAEGLADIAAVARVIGDPTRLAMLDALVEESDLPATELARRVGVSPSTASTHWHAWSTRA